MFSHFQRDRKNVDAYSTLRSIGSSALHSMLNECSDLLSPFLSALCNTSLRNGMVPASFKTAVVTPLIKKSSMDVNTLQNYRPISNLSFVSKLLERLVSTQLQ